MQLVEEYACFAGRQQVWQHKSETLKCGMKFAIFFPEAANSKKLPVLYWLSGLTCSEQNFITKAGAQRYAAEHNVIIVAPDTSPRGENIANDESYDLGQGAGFYLNATEQPWAEHYKMYDYIVQELPALIERHFPVSEKRAISGHSMGGHGALTIAFKNPQRYVSVSAFAPIVAPSQVPWGQKAFTHYLGKNQEDWLQYDATALLAAHQPELPILIDQGDKDNFLQEQLRPELFLAECKKQAVSCQFNLRPGYDHSYYFIASFIGEHIAFHAKALNNTL